MSTNKFGATAEEWDALASLCLEDVRPCVQNPNAIPTDGSVLAGGDKTPSLMRGDTKFSGILGWPGMMTAKSELLRWKSNPNHGAGIVGRRIHAIDIDVDDAELVEEIEAYITALVGELPTRRRYNSPRILMLFRAEEGNERGKTVTKMAEGKGAVEYLFKKQFIALAGTHKSGNRMYFEGGIPTSLDQIPVLSCDDLEMLVEGIETEFGNGVESYAENKSTMLTKARDVTQVDMDDHETEFVYSHHLFREILPEGSFAMCCPWQHEHESTGGEMDEDPSKVVYFPKGLGGREEAGFKCMHTSHPPKNATMFLEAIGYVTDQFECIAAPDEPEHISPPDLVRNKKGIAMPSVLNVSTALRSPEWSGWEVRQDNFTGRTTIKEYGDKPENAKPLDDAARVGLRLYLEQHRSFAPISKETMRDALLDVARHLSYDSAIDWLNEQKWDGVKRIDRFHADVLHAEDTKYGRALSRYLWTAMVGRLLVPGIKADMAPVFVGAQGTYKSTLVESLTPFAEWVGLLNLGDLNTDAVRTTQGKAIMALDELKGMSGREEESIKSFMTASNDEWVKKYQEDSTSAPRRYIMVGSSNQRRFLLDPTGNRRWLPIRVAVTKTFKINVELLQKHVALYWAEAKHMFETEGGVQWQEAEKLAVAEHPKFINLGRFHDEIVHWLDMQTDPSFRLEHIAVGVMGGAGSRHRQGDWKEIERVLHLLGYEPNENEDWIFQLA